ncbi:unnamed protein product, partial [Polarella glacialis]
PHGLRPPLGARCFRAEVSPTTGSAFDVKQQRAGLLIGASALAAAGSKSSLRRPRRRTAMAAGLSKPAPQYSLPGINKPLLPQSAINADDFIQGLEQPTSKKGKSDEVEEEEEEDEEPTPNEKPDETSEDDYSWLQNLNKMKK